VTATTATGTVLRAGGGVYDVETSGGEVVETSLRGRLKLVQRTGERVVAGDRVTIERQPDGAYTIEAVAERTTELARRSPRGGRRAKIIVANVDQMVVVFAATRPEPRLRLIDRFLVLAEANRIPAVVVVNKIDLVDPAATAERFAAYGRAGYPVCLVSAFDASGLEALRTLLCGRESVLAGPSGAGKSSLLNALEPGLGLRIGAVSEAVGKGKHTTVSAQLIPLACGGYVADTPGLRELGLWEVEKDELRELFPEFLPLRDECRFSRSCTHLHEPECTVQQAVRRGEVDRERYESYAAMMRDEEP
jgi:ribosome biogenesis GTPase